MTGLLTKLKERRAADAEQIRKSFFEIAAIAANDETAVNVDELASVLDILQLTEDDFEAAVAAQQELLECRKKVKALPNLTLASYKLGEEEVAASKAVYDAKAKLRAAQNARISAHAPVADANEAAKRITEIEREMRSGPKKRPSRIGGAVTGR